MEEKIMKTPSLVLLVILMPGLSAGYGCEGDPAAPVREATPPPILLPAVHVQPAFAVLYPGEEIRLDLVLYPRGDVCHLIPDDLEWVSTRPEVATVSSEGLVRGLARGETMIRATGDHLLVSATIRVR